MTGGGVPHILCECDDITQKEQFAEGNSGGEISVGHRSDARNFLQVPE